MSSSNRRRLRSLVIALATVASLVVTVPARADQGDFSWAHRFGGGLQEAGFAVATDRAGNVYWAGTFFDTAGMDPSAGTVELISHGGKDVFLIKFDPFGEVIWTRSWGGSGEDDVYDVAIDAAGNVLLVGVFDGTVDFDPGDGTEERTSSDARDLYVLALDSDGDFQWVDQFVSDGTITQSALAVDGSGNVGVAGTFYGEVDFDPGVGTMALSPLSAGFDAFVVSLDAAGSFRWARQFGAAFAYTSARGAAFDSVGNLYVTGDFSSTQELDLDPGSGTFLISPTSHASYVMKLDTDGGLLWGRYAARYGCCYAISQGWNVAADRSGGVVVVGSFSGLIDFDPGDGTSDLTSGGSSDGFVWRLDGGGNLIWVRQFVTSNPGQSGPRDVALTASGSIYIAGSFLGTADFDPGPGTFEVTAVKHPTFDAYAVRLDAEGDLVWARTWGGPDLGDNTTDDGALGVVTDQSGGVYVTGYFSGTIDADPSEGTLEFSTSGYRDALIEKFVDPEVVRYAGSNRYGTARAVSEADFPVPAPVTTVFVATGADYPDALAGAAVAGRMGAPLLLVTATGIPSDTAADLTRLGPDQIVILGGTSAIGANVETALGSYATTVTRVFGANRYATAVAISQFGFPGTATEVVVATGAGFADALAGGPAAVALDAPVLLTAPDFLPQVVATEIARLAPDRIIVVGGTGAISDDVVAALQAIQANTVRIAGANRYATSVAISTDAFAGGAVRAYLATGANFPDALAGAAAAGWWSGPILLVPGTSIPGVVSAEITRLGATKVVILGGTAVVGVAVETAAATLIGV